MKYYYKVYNINILWTPPLGLVPWRSPSLGYAKKGRVGRLSRRPSGHGGCSVPMNRWTNEGGSIGKTNVHRGLRGAAAWKQSWLPQGFGVHVFTVDLNRTFKLRSAKGAFLSLNTIREYAQALPLRVKSFPFLCFGENSIFTLIFISALVTYFLC